jgi:hypothetical protein
VLCAAQIVPSVGESTFCLTGTAYCPPKPQNLEAALQRTYVFDPESMWLQMCISQQKLLPVPKALQIDPARLTRAHGDTIEQRLRAVGFHTTCFLPFSSTAVSSSTAGDSSAGASAASDSMPVLFRSQATFRSGNKRRGNFESAASASIAELDAAIPSAKRVSQRFHVAPEATAYATAASSMPTGAYANVAASLVSTAASELAHSYAPAAASTPISASTSAPSSVPAAASAPSSVPAAASAPSSVPAAASTPSSVPAAASTPSSVPAAASAPSSVPAAASTPSSVPAAASTPSSVPAAASAPSSAPTAASVLAVASAPIAAYAPAASAASSAPAASPFEPASQLRSSLGWTILPPSRATTRMAKAWQEHTANTLPKLDQKLPGDGSIKLRGGGVQTHFNAILAAAESRPSLHHILARQHERDEATLRSLLRSEIGAEAETQLKLACSAHLSFSPGCEQQELHMDIKLRELARQCYVVIAYLTNCSSTHLPIAGDTTDLLWIRASAHQLRIDVKVEDRFLSETVAPGAVLLMRGDTAHFGPANSSQETRLCAYFLFSPLAGCDQAADQRYPHGV